MSRDTDNGWRPSLETAQDTRGGWALQQVLQVGVGNLGFIPSSVGGAWLFGVFCPVQHTGFVSLGVMSDPMGPHSPPQTIFSDVLFAAFHGWLRAETSGESGGRLCPEIFCRLSPSMLGVILG